MTFTRIWPKGQITIPASYREALHLDENSRVNIILIGKSIVITPQPSKLEEFSQKMEKEIKKKGITLEDVLKGLRQTRKEHNKEKYGL